MALLEVNNLSVEFSVDGQWLPAVSNISFKVEKGEILALVGESGCGKSVSCLSLARLLPEPPARFPNGKIQIKSDDKEYDILSMTNRELRKIRGAKIAYIFQEPSVSLNPVFRVGDQIAEAIELHQPKILDIKKEATNLLRQVEIPEPEKRLRSYPHEMSGGMQQRVMIAMALASKPDLLIADEPTTALDVTIQSQILELLCELRKNTGMAIILVTHNLGIVAEVADRVIVMYAGHTVESSKVDNILNEPLHPYTKALLSAVPKLGRASEKLTTIPGNVPTPRNYPKGCRFFGRCELCQNLSRDEQKVCAEQVPKWQEVKTGHLCRCWKVDGIG